MVDWYWEEVVLWYCDWGIRLDVCFVYLGWDFLVGVGFKFVLCLVGDDGVVSCGGNWDFVVGIFRLVLGC